MTFTFYPFQNADKNDRVVINIGTNVSPLHPSEFDSSTVVLAFEANVRIANFLREKLQKEYPHRFFVINCAVSNPSETGEIAPFRFYNKQGESSSLSISTKFRYTESNHSILTPQGPFGPGKSGFDIVHVIGLDAVLASIPEQLKIIYLKTDSQGHDFSIISSASKRQIRRIPKISSETYCSDGAQYYKNVRNNIEKDWIPYMNSIGFKLMNPQTSYKSENQFDAIWLRED